MTMASSTYIRTNTAICVKSVNERKHATLETSLLRREVHILQSELHLIPLSLKFTSALLPSSSPVHRLHVCRKEGMTYPFQIVNDTPRQTPHHIHTLADRHQDGLHVFMVIRTPREIEADVT